MLDVEQIHKKTVPLQHRNMKIIKGDFTRELALQLSPSIKAGFPSPAEDYMHDTIDFNRDIIKNPEATFYGVVSGDSMIDAGINDGDIAVIDRSVEPSDGDIIVASSPTERKATSNCVRPTRTISPYASTASTTSRCGELWCGPSRSGNAE